jgi:DNA polymerase III epsilon subunit-like protein
MRVCVLDTETNGLLKGGFKPHALQLSYVILNSLGVCSGRIIEKRVDRKVRISKTTELSEESISIHGITRERSEKEGKEMKWVLEEWRDEIRKRDVKLLVGHNIEYDLKVLELESERNGWSGLFGEKGLLGVARGEDGIGVYCTAKESVGVCNVRGEGGKYLKYVKLIEVYRLLFDELDKSVGMNIEEYEKYLHDSRMDVLVCLRIYIKLSYGEYMCGEWKRELERYELRRSSRISCLSEKNNE